MQWPIRSHTVYVIRLGRPDVAECDRMRMKSAKQRSGGALASARRDLGGHQRSPRELPPVRPGLQPWGADPVGSRQHKEDPAIPASLAGDGREGPLRAHLISSKERCFIMKPQRDPHDDDPTLAHLVMRWSGRLREWAAKKAAQINQAARRYDRDVKRQVMRGASYSVGSGAVSILIVWWQNRH